VDSNLIWTGDAAAPFEATVELIRDENSTTVKHDLRFRREGERWLLSEYQRTEIGASSKEITVEDRRWRELQDLFVGALEASGETHQGADRLLK
jgi:hypothetical protein